MKTKKIFFIINGLGYGGAETQLLRLSKALLEKNYDVSILTITNDLALLSRLPAGVKHFNVPLRKNLGLFSDLRYILKLVKKESPDVIHAHLFQSNILSRLIKVFNKNIRVINTTHGSYLLKSRNYNPYKIYRYTQKWVDYHTAVSNEVLNLLHQYQSLKKEKSAYIPNGLFVKKYFKINKNQNIFRWVSIGRFHPVKNFSSLIEACYDLKKNYPNFELHIAGDGQERSKLRDLIEKFELSNNIKLVGTLDDIPSFLSEADAFVINSSSEGLPMVLLEAMASSLPILSTNVGEIENILKASKGGVVIPAQDNKSLLKAMNQVLSYDRNHLNKLGKRNRD